LDEINVPAIISNSDLSGDGIRTSDRPVGIKRNSGTTPNQLNVDLRYSRFFSNRRLETMSLDPGTKIWPLPNPLALTLAANL